VVVNVSALEREEFGAGLREEPQEGETVRREVAMQTKGNNIVRLGFVVQYRIKDAFQSRYRITHPRATLRDAAQAAIREVVGRTTIDGLGIHFIHQRSPHAEARPLLITHGWPGSVVEFHKVIEPLVNPTEHGGDASDAFHVVCPSLPGYGFSSKPRRTGWGVERIADAWSQLMQALGYPRYLAQGGDWGAMVTTQIGTRDPEHCAAIHLNMPLVPPDPETMSDLTEREQAAMAGMQHYQDKDSGYSKQQSTRPQTLGYGLVDSPVAQMTWILEKFWAWTDCDGHPENALTRDEMLDNVMFYWLTRSGASSARLYWESFGSFVGGARIEVPCGVAAFPKEIIRAPRPWCEAGYNITHWTDMEAGGHFAAFEQPAAFVADLRTFFATVV